MDKRVQPSDISESAADKADAGHQAPKPQDNGSAAASASTSGAVGQSDAGITYYVDPVRFPGSVIGTTIHAPPDADRGTLITHRVVDTADGWIVLHLTETDSSGALISKVYPNINDMPPWMQERIKLMQWLSVSPVRGSGDNQLPTGDLRNGRITYYLTGE